jgi:hypothetical protein
LRYVLFAITFGALYLAACGGSSFRDGVFRDAETTYRLAPLGSQWRATSFAGNDLAWTDGRGRVIAVNSVCSGHGDPSLKVLTDHLLLGFEERTIEARDALELDGRGALRTRARASMDGVPVDLELTLLKKDGCVYDLIYTAPPGGLAEGLDAYRALVSSFRTGAGRS